MKRYTVDDHGIAFEDQFGHYYKCEDVIRETSKLKAEIMAYRNQLYRLILWFNNRSEGFRKRCNRWIWKQSQMMLDRKDGG